MVESIRLSRMKQFLVFALVLVAMLVLISGHPVEDQKITLEDAEAQPGVDDGTGIRAARHFGGGFRRGGFCCGGGGGYGRGGFGGGGFGGYPGGGYGGYPGGGYGGGSASASASASASSSWGR
ncbi:glycine-rich RNA-binding protein 1 [Drosophila eugracilis]|uniref:glycine-rich RNA-binding protein 1 n=1 Tax=Drosophila eugracilis TaxID=29029 RepID=UPI0007E7E4DF|nr:glycine-rich RNA-binding protein 1 [Drosophila eugracilis]